MPSQFMKPITARNKTAHMLASSRRCGKRGNAHLRDAFLGHATPKSLRGQEHGRKKYGGSHRPFGTEKTDSLVKYFKFAKRKEESQKGLKESRENSIKERQSKLAAFIREMRGSPSDMLGLFIDAIDNSHISSFFTDALYRSSADSNSTGLVIEWLDSKGYFNPVPKDYFDSWEVKESERRSLNYQARSIKHLYENATSPISKAFAIHWLHSHALVHKKQAQPEQAVVIGQGGIPMATTSDLIAFISDWMNIKDTIFFFVKPLADKRPNWVKWANVFCEMFNSSGAVVVPNEQPIALKNLDNIGLLKFEQTNMHELRRIALEQFGAEFLGKVNALQSTIAKALLWRLFEEKGWTGNSMGQDGKEEHSLKVAKEYADIWREYSSLRLFSDALHDLGISFESARTNAYGSLAHMRNPKDNPLTAEQIGQMQKIIEKWDK